MGRIAAIVYCVTQRSKETSMAHIDQFLNDKQAGIKKIFFYLPRPRS